MKKTGIIIVNVLIIIALLTFVVLYSRHTNGNMTQRQIEHFENTTITMEHVTENYLEGEQRICDVWARYINSKDMTIEEAVSFIRISHVLQNASAHIIYDDDTLSGLSTRARLDDPDDYSVSYARTNLLTDKSWIHDIGESINISRAYTNPVNGEQSLAFCNNITLHDPESGELRRAILPRVLPGYIDAHSGVYVRISEESPEELEKAVSHEGIDLVIGSIASPPSSYRTVELCRKEQLLVVPILLGGADHHG